MLGVVLPRVEPIATLTHALESRVRIHVQQAMFVATMVGRSPAEDRVLVSTIPLIATIWIIPASGSITVQAAMCDRIGGVPITTAAMDLV